MNRRLLLLDLALVLFAAGLVWLLRERYLQARAHELAVLRSKVPPKPVLAPQTPPLARPSQPAEYADVAQRTLFSKDRNPNVVIEPPKPAPEKPMPALPIYHGQLGFGDEPVALLSLPNQAATQKGYRAGDKVGEFKLVAFDRDKIEFEWNGKKVERKPEELFAKEPAAAPAAAASAAVPPSGAPLATGGTQSANIVKRMMEAEAAANGVTPATASVNSLSPSANSSAANSAPAGLGDEIGTGTRACLPGDNSPAGTVLGGYQKRMITSMFGSVCRWEQVK